MFFYRIGIFRGKREPFENCRLEREDDDLKLKGPTEFAVGNSNCKGEDYGISTGRYFKIWVPAPGTR